MYEIRTILKEELNLIVKNLPKQQNEIFEGFHFFKIDSSSYNQIYFIVTTEEQIVGIVKLGNSGNYGKHTWYMNYIDIHVVHKRRGLSKKLFKRINEWAKEQSFPICIYAGIEELEGREANISEVARKYIVDVPYCANSAELAEYIEKVDL